jgi:hypothetical protein
MACVDMVRAILDYVQAADEAHLRDVALREMNMALDECNSRNWKKLLASQDITLVASTDAYTLEDNFRDPLVALLVDSSGRRARLGYEEWRTFHDLYDDRANYPSPEIYSIDYGARQLVLQGQPNATFVTTYPTVTLHYYRRLVYLTCGSSTHGGPPEFNAFLIWQARAGLAAIRGEATLARYAEGKASALYAQLRRSDGNVVSDWT